MKLVFTLMLIALLFAVTEAIPLGAYVFNWIVYWHAVGSMVGCWYIGVWGIFWDDDDGAMTATCLDFYSGSQVTFPVEYADDTTKE